MEGNKHYITLFVFVDAFEGDPQLVEPHKVERWDWFELHALPSPLFSPVQSLLKKLAVEGAEKDFPSPVNCLVI